MDPFIGRWTCTETRTLTFTTPAGSPDGTTQSRLVLDATIADDYVSMYETNEGRAPCRLNYTKTETSAVLMDGQGCLTLDGITLTYKMGTADVGSTRLQTNLVFDFYGLLEDPVGGSLVDATGTGTITSVCARVVPVKPSGTTG
jgi:hypothetical protein